MHVTETRPDVIIHTRYSRWVEGGSGGEAVVGEGV